MTNKNITVVVQDPMPKIDQFEWRGRIESETFLAAKVCWKGHHVLDIKKMVDLPKPASSRFIDDDDEDDDEEPPTQPEPKTEYLVQITDEWDWLKHNYSAIGEKIQEYEEAEKLGVKSIEEIFRRIRKAFMLKGIQ